jgi:hypothetical protein
MWFLWCYEFICTILILEQYSNETLFPLIVGSLRWEPLDTRATGESSTFLASRWNHYPWNHTRRSRWGRLVVYIMATAPHLIIDAVALGVLLWLWKSNERLRHALTSVIQSVARRYVEWRKCGDDGWHSLFKLLPRGKQGTVLLQILNTRIDTTE